MLTDYDIYLLREGTHYNSYNCFGSHLGIKDGAPGAWFSVWAPNATRVSVVGDFNSWNEETNLLQCLGDSGIWQGFIPEIKAGDCYKYSIHSRVNGYTVFKADPYAFSAEFRPKTASRVWDLSSYQWSDGEWLEKRAQKETLQSALTIYELHLGSWKRKPEEGNRFLTYRELASELPAYLTHLGFTHVEFLPIQEHPFDGSWGYQTTGYFAPTSRFGTPEDLMHLIDTLHQHGIGVILDWSPAHFPSDQHGLSFFDGTHLYEHADPRKGFHPDWGSLIFNYGRREVQNFLISAACFWFDKYHIDAIRVDAVASMLYLDYSRTDWVPNEHGGRENIEAIDFMRRLNETIYNRFPGAFTVAEESTAWPMVSRPTTMGGLGFGLKWNMGWMNDVLGYISKDPIHRAYHHNALTFGLLYAFHENFILPLSHDEVVHGKNSLIRKMPGDDWQKFANLRLLLGFMYGHPGKKLLFMGGEFGQWDEWNHDKSLDWHLTQFPLHQGLMNYVADLNRTLRSERALYEVDFDPAGFSWIDCNDREQSVLSFLRSSKDGSEKVLVVCNFTPLVRRHYRLGVPQLGLWLEIVNSDSEYYGGSGVGNFGGMYATPEPYQHFPCSLQLSLPPLGMLMLKLKEE